VVAFLNRGGSFTPQTIFAAPHPAWGSSGIDLVDLDRDGRVDVLMTNGDMLDEFLLKPYHGISWLENQGAFPFKEHVLAPLNGVHRAQAVDLDGDGDLDVVACTLIPGMAKYGKALPSLVWLEQTGRGQFVRHTLETGGYHASLDLGDVDGDGDPDIVTGNFQVDGQRTDAWVEVWVNERPSRKSGRGNRRSAGRRLGGMGLRGAAGALVGALLAAFGAAAGEAPPPPDFERDVAPILQEHCASCHGADKQENLLRLDSRSEALKGGMSGPAIVPGKSGESLLVQHLTGQAKPRMPHEKPPLAPEVVATLAAWIDAGAPGPDAAAATRSKAAEHWGFVAPVRPAVPAATPRSANAIDAFVRARLAHEGLQPSRPPIASRCCAARASTSSGCRLRSPRSTPS
jgi:hypothetical protein